MNKSVLSFSSSFVTTVNQAIKYFFSLAVIVLKDKERLDIPNFGIIDNALNITINTLKHVYPITRQQYNKCAQLAIEGD